MLLDKLKLALMLFVVVLAGLAGTTGLLPLRTVAAGEPDDAVAQPRSGPVGRRAAATSTPAADGDPAIQGIWSLQRILRDGKTKIPGRGKVTLIVTNRYMIWKEPSNECALAYKVNTATNPKHIDLTLLEPRVTPVEPPRGKVEKVLGVYAILADTLVIHESDGLRPRDTSFNGTMGSTVFIYRRLGDVSPASVAATSSEFPESGGAWADKLFKVKGPTRHDFGKMPRGTQAENRFHLRNIYNVPLDISNTRVSCGCVVVSVSTKRLEPNEEGYIDLQVDTRRFSGDKTITIFVEVRAGEYVSTATLRVSAESVVNEPVKARQEALRGKIVNVDDKSQLVQVDIGTDQGVKLKQVLEIFRLQPRARIPGQAAHRQRRSQPGRGACRDTFCGTDNGWR